MHSNNDPHYENLSFFYFYSYWIGILTKNLKKNNFLIYISSEAIDEIKQIQMVIYNHICN